MSWRRRIASLVLLAAVVLVGGKLLSARDKLVPVEITYALPEGVVYVEVTVRPGEGGAEVARFAAQVPSGERELRHTTRLPPGEVAAEVTVRWARDAGGGGGGDPGGGAEQTVTRRFKAVRDARVRLDVR